MSSKISWCPGRGSNPQGVTAARGQVWCVCQFRHPGTLIPFIHMCQKTLDLGESCGNLKGLRVGPRGPEPVAAPQTKLLARPFCHALPRQRPRFSCTPPFVAGYATSPISLSLEAFTRQVGCWRPGLFSRQMKSLTARPGARFAISILMTDEILAIDRPLLRRARVTRSGVSRPSPDSTRALITLRMPSSGPITEGPVAVAGWLTVERPRLRSISERRMASSGVCATMVPSGLTSYPLIGHTSNVRQSTTHRYGRVNTVSASK